MYPGHRPNVSGAPSPRFMPGRWMLMRRTAWPCSSTIVVPTTWSGPWMSWTAGPIVDVGDGVGDGSAVGVDADGASTAARVTVGGEVEAREPVHAAPTTRAATATRSDRVAFERVVRARPVTAS